MSLGGEGATAARGHPPGAGPAAGPDRRGDPGPDAGGAAQPRQPRGGAALTASGGACPRRPDRRGKPGGSLGRGGGECMSPRVLFVLAVVVAGCAPKDTGAPAPAAVESLPVLRPASGGAMVLLPAGTFTMGDAAGRPD